MQAFVINHPDQARTLLIKHPQMAYALFQALLLSKIVDPVVLERMLAESCGSNASTFVRPVKQQHQPPVGDPHHMELYDPGQHIQQIPPFPLQTPYRVQQMYSPTPTVGGQADVYICYPQSMQPQRPSGMQPHYWPPPLLALPLAPMGEEYTNQSHVAPVEPALAELVGEIGDAQRKMLIQVMSMTPQQIENLADAERSAAKQLVSWFFFCIHEILTFCAAFTVHGWIWCHLSSCDTIHMIYIVLYSESTAVLAHLCIQVDRDMSGVTY